MAKWWFTSMLHVQFATICVTPSFLTFCLGDKSERNTNAIRTETRDTEKNPGSRLSRYFDNSETTVDVTLAVFQRQHVHRAAIFSCQSPTDRRLIRTLTTQFPTLVITPTTLWKLENVYFRTGIVLVPEACPLAAVFLSEGLAQPYVNSTYRWLVVSQHPAENILNLFRNITFRFDTSITVAVRESSGSYKLLDVYRDALHAAGTIQTKDVGRFLVGGSTDIDTGVTKASSMVDWIDAENAVFRSRVHRGVHTGLLVTNLSDCKRGDTLERFTLLRGHPRVPAIAYVMQSFGTFAAVTPLYNISLIPHCFSQSGSKNKYGVFSGVVGGVQSQQLEISVTKIIMTHERKEAGDFLNTCEPFRVGVIYYVGRSVETPGAVLKAFSPALWAAVVGVFVVGISSLFCAGRWEMKQEATRADFSVGAFGLVMLATFSGQGHPTALFRLSSRAVLAVVLLTGFVLAQAYSAVIIRSLLSAPAPNIRTWADFMKAPLKMAVENYFHFPSAIFTPSMDPETRALYEKKVRPPHGGGYCPFPDAFQGVLRQRWAMFGIVNNIKQEMTKATPVQVCRLMWIKDLQRDYPICPMVSRKSELKDLLSRGYSLALERGLHNREIRRHLASDVQCQPGHRRQWAPVKLKLVLSAVALVLAGVGVSAILCGIEQVSASRRFNKLYPRKGFLSLLPGLYRR